MRGMSTQPEGRIPTAAYVRLSREDGSRGDEGSIETQIDLVHDFIAEASELSLYDTYTDNGFTGTNFCRPAFERMMEDVMRGRVQCIVVKDLSRFGRDYLDAGTYIENIFPRLGVRLISINDGFDSARPGDALSLELPVRDLVNTLYARDISKKIRFHFAQKDRRGEWLGSAAPYGYLLEVRGDKRTLIPDPSTAPFVRKVFQWYLEGSTMAEIARRLDAAGAPTPSQRKAQLGRETGRIIPHWGRKAIQHILGNLMYTGDTVNRKTFTLAGKSAEQGRDSWHIIPNTHEALISKEIFERAAELRRERTEARHSSAAKVSRKATVVPLAHFTSRATPSRKENVRIREELSGIADKEMKAYEDYACGLLDRDSYLRQKEQLRAQRASLLHQPLDKI